MRGRGVHEDPISLFSFQDIITSVTGIIILLALLLVVELTKRPKQVLSRASDKSSSHEQAEIRDLEGRIVAVKELLASSSKFANDMASIPAAEVQAAKEEVRKEITALEAALAQLGQDEQQSQSVAQSQGHAAESVQEKMAALRSQNDELQSQLEEVRRSNRVIYSSEDSSTKSAWLVDLKANEILVGKPKQDDASHAFESAGFEAAFLNWAEQRNSQAEYFVLLVRPESIQVYEEISQSLKDRGFSLGFDLLSSDATAMESLNSRGAGP